MLLEAHAGQVERLMAQGYDCLKQKQQQQALLYFNSVVLLEPKHVDALKNCADILLGLNRPAEATVYSHHAFQLNPNSYSLSLHAKALYQMGKYHEALECFERILAEEPNNYTAMGQRALCLTQVNRYDEALQAYQNALVCCNNQDVWIQYNYSLCLLAMGNLLQGFASYEYRWLSSLSEERQAWIVPDFVNRDRLQGKSILIHSEQGLGDGIQFFRYIPLLVQLGARIYLEMQPALIPLFYEWRHTIRLIARGSPLPSCDYHCPVMSLARLFKTEIHTIPNSIPYVFPELQTLETCQAKLGHSSCRRIGIAWRGSATNPMNQKRSLALNALLTVHQSNLDFICLQKDVYLEEKKVLDQYQMTYHSLELSTMMGTAALIACLDLVITVDTSIAHLAAAMGKEVWILLPVNADWRWFLLRADSPWYPNVKLFRQETLGDWDIPLTRIKKALATLAPVEQQLNIDDLIQTAHQKLQQGLQTEAEQLYRYILINNPGCHTAAQGIALAALQKHNLAEAILFMQRAVEIAPTQIVYRRNLGELLCRAGQMEAALASHQLAIRMEPHHPENHFLLALTYNNNQQFELAIRHYRIALSYDQNYGLAWNNLGASLESMGDKHQAKIAYATAIRLNPNHAEALNNLGAIYSEEGRINEARLHFEAAIAARADFIEAHYNLSLVKTYAGHDPHLVFLEAMAQKIEHYSIPARIQYYFALGKALDDTQQYKRAFQAYAAGNRLHALLRPWNKTVLQDFVQQMPAVFTPSFLKQAKPTKETRCPIFIVGMPRAGTTLIEQILCSHEQIYGAGELSILDDLIQEACHAAGLTFMRWVSQLTDNDFTILGEQYLERTWKLAPDKQFIIDKMPSNCFYVGMIYRMLPNAKIIHAMRDPLDSCFSCFTHLFKTSMLFTYDLTTLGDYYLLYAQAMEYWQKVLPANFIFDLAYEQMVAHHEALSRQLIAYIGLPWDPNCLNFYKNDRIVKTASLTQVRKPIYKTSVKRWQHFAEELQPLLKMLKMPHCNNAEAYLSKGSVLMEMGELIKAEEHFLKITAEHNIDTQVLAHYSLVQLRKVQPDNTSLQNLLAIVKDNIQAVSASKLEYVYFALGKCYEDLGEWAKSFEYFSLGCQL
ncbi:MAG: tetratricopeptide repeat protein, partial [Legionella sp.]